ncbi:MAG: transporter substrate-binding domain-containing protein [Clostridia bacterium]|nr:transporter substrate-binding domain-containing protein [Clostridia bacterium]
MKKTALLTLFLTLILLFSACGDEMILETPSDLTVLRVGAVASTSSELYAKDVCPDNLTVFETMDEAVEALAANTVDCLVTDVNTAKDIASDREDITTTETRVIENVDYSVAVRADDFDMLAISEVVTSELHKKTEFTKLCRGFIENTGDERDALITADQIGSSGLITLGTTAQKGPYAYSLANGKVAGIDVEYAKKFAQKLNSTLEIKTYENESDLSKALKSGEIDFFFIEHPLPAAPGINYSTSCYTVELRILILEY